MAWQTISLPYDDDLVRAVADTVGGYDRDGVRAISDLDMACPCTILTTPDAKLVAQRAREGLSITVCYDIYQPIDWMERPPQMRWRWPNCAAGPELIDANTIDPVALRREARTRASAAAFFRDCSDRVRQERERLFWATLLR